MIWFPPHAQPPIKGRAKTHTIKDSATLIFCKTHTILSIPFGVYYADNI